MPKKGGHSALQRIQATQNFAQINMKNKLPPHAHDIIDSELKSAGKDVELAKQCGDEFKWKNKNTTQRLLRLQAHVQALKTSCTELQDQLAETQLELTAASHQQKALMERNIILVGYNKVLQRQKDTL